MQTSQNTNAMNKIYTKGTVL